MKFRLGHFTRLQILFGFGTIVNLRYTSRLGLSSLALTNMITNMMQVNSSKVQGLLVSIGFTSQVFQIWLTIVLLVCPFMTWSIGLPRHEHNRICFQALAATTFLKLHFLFKTWHPKFWNVSFFQLHSQVLTMIVLFKTWLSKSWILFGFLNFHVRPN